MTDYPHVPAAFINAISEEGTKAEAVQYLQKQWNESCYLRAQLQKAISLAERLDYELWNYEEAEAMKRRKWNLHH